MTNRQLRIVQIMCALLLWSTPLFAARGVVLYLDGAVVTREETARKGYLEIPVPPAARPGSLAIKPVDGAKILRVQLVSRQPARKTEKELAAIADRQELLQDRLKALSIREDVFRSAAKSQSAKAPKRTKANPEPLTSIRQGTDYAISQLESVFQAKRRVDKELKQLEEKRARLVRDEQVGGSVARVWTSPASARVVATYLQSDRSWQPAYEVRVEGAERAQFAILPAGVSLQQGESGKLVLSGLADGRSVPQWNYADAFTPVNVTGLQIANKIDAGGQLPRLSLAMTNTTGMHLPAGELACYADGAYLGIGRFPGLEAGKTLEFICNSN